MDVGPNWRSSQDILIFTMKIGIICEGHTDRAVIKNLVKGITGIEYARCTALRPEDDLDDTDLAHLNPNSFGSWTNVREECNSRNKIGQFLSIEGQEWIIIQLDTLQADDFGIQRPSKDEKYSTQLRALVIATVNGWLGNEFVDHIAYAIAIEEIEAWLLTIFINSNSTSSAGPKAKLKSFLGRKKIDNTENYNTYFKLSEPFAKAKNHQRNNYSRRNESLAMFCQELVAKMGNQIGSD